MSRMDRQKASMEQQNVIDHDDVPPSSTPLAPIATEEPSLDDETSTMLMKNDGCSAKHSVMADDIPITGGFVMANNPEASKDKMKRAFEVLVPWTSAPKEGNYLPAETPGSGWFRLMATSWLSGKMYKAYKSGLGYADIYQMNERDQAVGNAERLERIWNNEITDAAKSRRKPSFVRCAWRFCRTRMLISSVLMMFAIIFQFLGPSVMTKMLLEYLNNPSMATTWGWGIVITLSIIQFARTMFYMINFNIGVLTAVRFQGAAQYLGFSKLLRLSSPNDADLGKLVTFCSADQERIFEGFANMTLVVGTPVMFLASVVYSCVLIGPIALLGCLVILLFYPLMGAVAAGTSLLRMKVASVTDKRVGLMNELINSVRLVKMYAWESPFADKIMGVRQKERKQLRNAAFLQCVSMAVTPSVTIIASVVTFVALSGFGYPLTAPDAFTVFSIFISLQFTVGTLPYALRCITEANVALRRMQVFLELPEYKAPDHMPENMLKGTIVMDSTSFSVNVNECKQEKKIGIKPSSILSKRYKKLNGRKVRRAADHNEPEEENLNHDSFQNGGSVSNDGKEIVSGKVATQPCTESVQVLHDVNLKISPGQLVGVAGGIGSGKSCLLSALLGEINKDKGEVSVSGRLAYVPQQAWIFAGSIRENILFGLNYNKERYHRVLDACALSQDLERFNDGDETEVGERGITLSGGQKQRISLARSIYSSHVADIYLLDDPLSAVDAKVAAHIFQCAILDELKDKTVILVTHSLQFLLKCDVIAVMKDGKVAEFGTHSELTQNVINTEYLALSPYQHQTTNDSRPQNPPEQHNNIETKSKISLTHEVSASKLVKEESDTRDAGWSVLLEYFKACGGGYRVLLGFFVVLLFCLSRLFTFIWLKVWIDSGDGRYEERVKNITLYNLTTLTEDEMKGFVTDHPNMTFFQLMHGLSLVLLVFMGCIKGLYIAVHALEGSSKLHDQMLQRIIHAPMTFFDSTPSGRIINRFSKDMDELDVRMPFFVEFLCQAVLICLSQLILVCAIYPVFTVFFLFIISMFGICDYFMNKGISEARKLENKTKSAVLHHLSSSYSGLVVIRGFQRQGLSQKRFNSVLNRNLAAQAMFNYSNRWFSFRMEMLGNLTVLVTATAAVAFKESVFASGAGLALSNTFATAVLLPFLVRLKAEFVARFNSVERVAEYAKDIEQEKDVEKNPLVRTDWPLRGDILFKDVNLIYTGGQLALRGINLDIAAGTKVGIVGRTGAGKTSLISSLLRMSELHSGKICIDGVDISDISLNNLRSSIALIPQDPVLFQGTIRYNLDPFDQYEDSELWKALEKAHLKDKMLSGVIGCGFTSKGDVGEVTFADAQSKITDDGDGMEKLVLSSTVETGGDNFSAGEKQLICLARALLRNNKILLLDEATASVDIETDYLIQATIQEAFADRTVLTIAHRLHTVINSDKIIVLHDGEVVEFAKPKFLLDKEDGYLRSMMDVLPK